MDVREQILRVGRDLLVEGGLRAITTNAIAQRARISKKTLYQYFPSKDELLEAILVSFVEENLEHWDEILERDDTAIHRISASLRFVSEFLPQIQSHVIAQVESVAPHLWNTIDAIHTQRLRKLKALIEDAQQEGTIRDDVDPDHWILLLTGAIRSVVKPKVLLRTGILATDLFASIQTIYYHGLLTEKGRLANKETS